MPFLPWTFHSSISSSDPSLFNKMYTSSRFFTSLSSESGQLPPSFSWYLIKMSLLSWRYIFRNSKKSQQKLCPHFCLRDLDPFVHSFENVIREKDCFQIFHFLTQSSSISWCVDFLVNVRWYRIQWIFFLKSLYRTLTSSKCVGHFMSESFDQKRTFHKCVKKKWREILWD